MFSLLLFNRNTYLQHKNYITLEFVDNNLSNETENFLNISLVARTQFYSNNNPYTPSLSHTCKNFDKNLVNFDMSIIVLVAAGRKWHSGKVSIYNGVHTYTHARTQRRETH